MGCTSVWIDVREMGVGMKLNQCLVLSFVNLNMALISGLKLDG